MKTEIKNQLLQFGSNDDLYQNTLQLFSVLGYESEHTLELQEKTYIDFRDYFQVSENVFSKDKAIVEHWKKIDFCFQIGEGFFEHKEVNTHFLEKYESYVIFALELKEEFYNKTQLTQITRELNKPFFMPVLVLFKYGTSLTLAVIDRRLNKKDEYKDVLSKVTLIKDINFSKPHRAHTEILAELSLERLQKKYTINSFPALHKAWRATLNLKELNKRFYREIANWYFWAVSNVEFPYDYLKKEERYQAKTQEELQELANQKAVIRFVTRIFFVWFLKEKKLIPENLFYENVLTNTLKNFDPKSEESSEYYLAILQNLFFATLNRPKADRAFALKQEHVKNINSYGVNNLYRYESLFADSDTQKIMDIFESIPFLNGGLFDSLDDKENKMMIDGFSRVKKNQPKFPNRLLFGEETEDFSQELAKIYQTKKGNYKVKGIFQIFERYKFTIEENTPEEEDIALDPMLMGEVFESLLAYYNPETQATARKGTGSFYTPKEIVNYMVDESLKAYLQIDVNAPHTIENLNQEQKQALVKKISEIKILDPACGSGAFPMGILQRMVQLLQKIDPQNKLWQRIQKEKLFEELDRVYENDDKETRQLEVDKLNAVFENNLEDYGRKLYLIQNCIYGVDIQDIAVQISKLRFFLSLVIEQNNEKIEPLPNLETKFVVANTLIGIDLEGIKFFDKDDDSNDSTQELRTALKKVRESFFKAKSRKEKKSLEKQDKELREQIAHNLADGIKEKNTQEIAAAQEIISKQTALLQEAEAMPDEIKEIITKDLFGKEEKKRINAKKDKIDSIKSILKTNESIIKRLENDTEVEQIRKKALLIAQWNPYDQKTSSEWFDTEWMFGIKEGFDVVIGNPPYVQLQKMKEWQAAFEAQKYESYARTGDLYALFYEKGNQLLKTDGLMCYITSNKWMRAGYGTKLRHYFTTQTEPLQLIDLGGGIFESATVDTNILLSKKIKAIVKEPQKFQLKALTFQKTELSMQDYFAQNHITLTELSADSWTISSAIEQQIKTKIEEIGTPLKDWDIDIYRGVLTGFNEAFIIDEATKNEFIAQDPKSVEIIKPILRGRDIQRYKAEFADLYLINSHNGEIFKTEYPYATTKDSLGKIILIKYLEGKEKKFVVIPTKRVEILTKKSVRINREIVSEDYPAIYQHLLQFEKELQKRQDKGVHWTNLRNCAYLEEFEKEKIVWKRIGSILRFSYENNTSLCLDSTCFSSGENSKYLTALLNSKVCHYELFETAPKTGTGDLIISVQALEPIHVPKLSPSDQKPFEDLVDIILAKKEQGEDTSQEERKIDEMVYALYGLTTEEIAVVEGKG